MKPQPDHSKLYVWYISDYLCSYYPVYGLSMPILSGVSATLQSVSVLTDMGNIIRIIK